MVIGAIGIKPLLPTKKSSSLITTNVKLLLIKRVKKLELRLPMRSAKGFGQAAIWLSPEKSQNYVGLSASVSKDDSFNEAKMTTSDEIIITGSPYTNINREAC